jgi:hypothetical protein
MNVIGSLDDDVPAFKNKVVYENHRVAGQLHFLRKI